MNYFFLMLGLVSLGGLGILHKCADSLECRPSAVNVFLFVWAALMAMGILFVKTGLSRSLSVPPAVIVVAGICGGVSSVAILALQQALRYGQISTSWLIINLSTAIPTALSIVIYKEQVAFRQSLSLVLAVVSLLLLWRDRRKAEMAARVGIERPRDATKLCEEVSGLGLTLDYSPFIDPGYNQSSIEPLHRFTKHVHARQAAPGKRVEAVDEGSIDFKRVISLLKQQNYEGVIAVEYVDCQVTRECGVSVLKETIKMKTELTKLLSQASDSGQE